LAAPELRCGNFGLDRIDPHRKLSASEVDRMAKRNPILNAWAENQVIGYIEGTEAFDLMGNKRCNYTPSTGNLVEPDSRRIIGHVSLAGYFVGESWIADELFAGRVGKNAPIPLRAQLDAAASLCRQIHCTNRPLTGQSRWRRPKKSLKRRQLMHNAHSK
jgi:hypothetical protein